MIIEYKTDYKNAEIITNFVLWFEVRKAVCETPWFSNGSRMV